MELNLLVSITPTSPYPHDNCALSSETPHMMNLSQVSYYSLGISSLRVGTLVPISQKL